MPDEQKTCVQCGDGFVFTERDQEFYATQVGADGKPWTAPKRCKKCREAKKRARAEAGKPA